MVDSGNDFLIIHMHVCMYLYVHTYVYTFVCMYITVLSDSIRTQQ